MSNLGKFEGEPDWVSVLWDRANSGFADDSVYDGSLQFDGFKITTTIAELTGYSEDETRYVVLYESDDGFVSHTVMSSEEFFTCEGFNVEEPTSDFIPNDDFDAGEYDLDDLAP